MAFDKESMNDLDLAALTKHSLRGVIALISRTFFLNLISFSSFLFISVLLLPTELGVYTAVIAAQRIVSFFTDFGLGAALIQKKDDLTRADLKSAFTIQSAVTFAIFIVFASIAVIIATGVFFTFPLIKSEIQTVSSHLQLKHPSVFAEEFATAIEKNFPLIKQHGFSYDLTKYIHQVMDDLLKESFEIVFEFVHFVSLIFLVPVFTFFLLKDGRRLKKTIIQFVPNRYFEMTLNMVYKINQQIGSYIRGQLLDAIIVGILSIITLSLLNIRYSFLIGSVAGCANIIPHFGPIFNKPKFSIKTDGFG